MANNLFDNAWKESAEIFDGSWKSNVLDNISRSGNVYLNIISNWFFDFPGTKKEKNHLKASLKSPINTDLLGAVNELSWWKFWTSRNHDLVPIPAGKGSTPDFLLNVRGEETTIFEITTLNPSLNKKCRELNFSQNNSIIRIMAKATEEKIEQFKYGTKKNIPVVLVLFNYDEWTGFDTQFSREIENSDLSSKMPRELSGTIFLERYVREGQIYFKKESIVFIENLAPYLPLPIEIKTMIGSMLTAGNDWINCELSD